MDTVSTTQPHAPAADGSTRPLVGIEIGGTKLQIVLASEPTQITKRWRSDADRAGGGAAIQQQIATGLTELLGSTQPRAVGVGFGGPIDVVTGQICKSHQIDGWEQFALRAWLASLTGVSVAVENDANAAALGEATYGAGHGQNPVFYCNFGSGVGGGIVINGAIYHGQAPGEAEFGHLRLDRSGATVESCCSGWAVDRRIRALAIEHPHCDLARRIKFISGGEARYLEAAISSGDTLALQLVQDIAGDIAFALSHVVHLLHPQVIVIGGGLALVGEPLRQAVASALPSFVMEAFHPVPQVRLASLAEDAVTIGALELAARIAKIA